MKTNEIKDERILSERRKIQSEAYGWVVSALLLSIVAQKFFMNAPFEQYAVEFFTLAGCGIYISIRHYKAGIDIWNPKGDNSKKRFLNTVISGIASIILFAFLSGNYDIKVLAPYFITFVVFFFIFRSVMIFINNKKQQILENKLNETEDQTNE